MHIIDFHTHAFPDALAERAMRQLLSETEGLKTFLDGRIISLTQSMSDNNIEKSVLCCIATRPEQFDPIFRWCQEVRSETIVPFPSVHPLDSKAPERIRRIAKEGFLGIKMHPYYQDFSIDDPLLYPIYKAVSDCGLMLTLHTGFDIAFERIEKASPRQISVLITEFPDLRLITTHLGGWQQWDDVRRYLLGREIYMETSWSLEYLDVEQTRQMLLEHPAEYLLFGSDSPWTDQCASICAIKALGLPESRMKQLFYENANKLLAP